MASILKTLNGFQLFNKCMKVSIDIVPVRSRMNPPPRKRHPEWLPKPLRVRYDESLTPENKEFLSEISALNQTHLNFNHKSPLNMEVIEPVTEWTPHSRRTGLIGKKIGVYPMWLKNGKKVLTSLIQIIDNEVVKYMPPEEYNPVIGPKARQIKRKNGCLVIGAENIDPQLITKEYYGVFNKAGVRPKKTLMRFVVSPDAALQPGTPLCAAHFKPGQFLDIRGKTVDRGFQGVMKRWGFKGMPATHGVTKTHRRPGNIGSGGTKARVMPGTKMPGHMGNRWRILRGVKLYVNVKDIERKCHEDNYNNALEISRDFPFEISLLLSPPVLGIGSYLGGQILRINTKYNVIWVMAQNIPGETNTMCYLYDTILPTKRVSSPHFPTYLPNTNEDTLPENIYDDDVHVFNDATIEFASES